MKVYLMGDLGERFGSEWNMGVKTVPEVFQLIECQRAGFREYMIDIAEAGVNFTIRNGEEFLDEQDLLLSLRPDDLIITPIPVGAEGVGRVLAGIALIALTFWNPGGWFIAASGAFKTAGLFAVGVGINLALTGIQELLAPGPEVDKEEPDGYIFSGAQNNIAEGFPVPILYGEMRIGGAPINVNFTTKDISATGWIYTDANSQDGSFDPTPTDPGVT